MKACQSVLFVLLLFTIAPAFAVIESYSFDTPEQEALFKKMTQELRCLVCQNQNLADSNAELAQDLRKKTYEMIIAGKSESEIVEYMVARYGDFVLYRPPVKSSTLFLWIGPLLFLAIAIIVATRFVRSRQSASADPELPDEQLRMARDLLKKENQSS
jgi:cytochrome c-type biogenesis protein CcmH